MRTALHCPAPKSSRRLRACARIRPWFALGLLLGCTPSPRPACLIEDRVLQTYIACRRANPSGLPAGSLEAYKTDLHAMRAKYAGQADMLERTCAFDVDHLRVDMAGEGCDTSLSEAERGELARVRGIVTAPLAGSTAEATRILAEHARERDRTCACADQACVEAAKRDAATLPLERLQQESEEVHDNFDQIGAEIYRCATRPLILSPERWERVK